MHIDDIPIDPARGDDLFSSLYSEHFPALMRVAFLITGSNEAAEDAVQEVFIRCRDRLGDLDHPPSYLRAAVINECRTVHRRSQRRRPDPESPTTAIPTDLIELQDALGRLPWHQRSAIALRYLVDVPDDEIAQALGCRPSTVRSHIRRGITKLKATLS